MMQGTTGNCASRSFCGCDPLEPHYLLGVFSSALIVGCLNTQLSDWNGPQQMPFEQFHR